MVIKLKKLKSKALKGTRILTLQLFYLLFKPPNLQKVFIS